MLISAPCAGTNSTHDMPMPVPQEETAVNRWLNKPVQESRLLDDMTSPSTWMHAGIGRISFDGEAFTPGGPPTLRLTSPTIPEKPNTSSGRPFAEAVAQRVVSREDWTAYNRLSVHIRPDLPGFKVISLLIRLHNDGAVKVPDKYGREGLDYVLLKNNEWSHVVWEIPHLARDQVTGVDFVYRTQGNEPGATKKVRFDLAKLELQKVDADYYEGWSVAPGRIAYSHTGYELTGRKTAITSAAGHREFSVVRAEDSKVVMEKPAEVFKNDLGEFRVLDFSDLNQPGRYIVKYGNLSTRPFAVNDSIWRDTIWKTINLFFCERCGQAVPGIHDYCHGDWQGVHGDKKIVINGGWHDAGDLSQGIINTAQGARAMLALARQLKVTDPELSARLIDEGRWGMEWVLKTRFGDGYRITWAVIDYWIDNQIGTPDDTFAQARNQPVNNARGASAEAFASEVLRDKDPDFASRCLAAAEQDWRFAVDQAGEMGVELAAELTRASVDLYRATGKQRYADKAVETARTIIACQQRTFTPWKPPLTGFFYTTPKHEQILHYFHRSQEEAPAVALAMLCEALPEHPDWITWFSALTLNSAYLRTITGVNEPYRMTSASAYRLDERSDADFQEQVRQGIRLDDKHYLRRFPVWGQFRGNCSTTLTQAKALSVAARLDRNAALADLAREQMYWSVGRNPFGTSLMYGEGHDYHPQYTAMSGNMVGSLPVGIQTRGNRDVPYWSTATCYNHAEVWVHPAVRWIELMCDLYGPAQPAVQAPAVQMKLESVGSGADREIRLTLSGLGNHRAKLLADNLSLEGPAEREARLSGGPTTITWRGKRNADGPFVVVAIADGDMNQRITHAVYE
jgi:hypothetical protein